jgi:hypothetical protein
MSEKWKSFDFRVQGCQMVCFQTKNPNLGKFSCSGRYWYALRTLGPFYSLLLYFTVFCYIFYSILLYFTVCCYFLQYFVIFNGHLVYFVVVWYIFVPVLVFCAERKSGSPAFDFGSWKLDEETHFPDNWLADQFTFVWNTDDDGSKWETALSLSIGDPLQGLPDGTHIFSDQKSQFG